MLFLHRSFSFKTSLYDHDCFSSVCRATDKLIFQVFGLVYDIPEEHTDEVLRAMDEYEDCVGIPEGLAEYRRERVTVHLATHHRDGDHHSSGLAGSSSFHLLETWMYVWAQEVNNLVRVESGDYRSVYVKPPPSSSEDGGDLATA